MHCSEAENLSGVLAIGPIVGQSASDGGQGRYEPTHLPPIAHSYQTPQPAHRVQGISSTQIQVISVQPQSSSTQAELTNGVRHADPPDPMDDVLEVLMKNGGECLLKF